MQDRKIEFWIDEAVKLYFEGYAVKEAIEKARIMQVHKEQKNIKSKGGKCNG